MAFQMSSIYVSIKLMLNIVFNLIKLKVVIFIENNFNLREGIERVEKFSTNYLVFISNIDEYICGHRSKTRIFWATAARILILINAIRCLVPGFINNDMTRILLMDFTQYFGRSLLITTTWVSLMLNGLF